MRTALATLALLVAAPASASPIWWWNNIYDWGPSEAVLLDHHPFDLTWTLTRDGDDPFVFEFLDVPYVQQTHQQAMVSTQLVATITEANAASLGFDWEAFATAFDAPEGIWTQVAPNVTGTMTSPLGELSSPSGAFDGFGGRNDAGALLTHIEVAFRLFECINTTACDGIRGQSFLRVFGQSHFPPTPDIPEPSSGLLLAVAMVCLVLHRHSDTNSICGKGHVPNWRRN